MRRHLLPAALGLWLAIGVGAPRVTAQAVRISTVPVSGNVYMLIGQGGNIGLTVGKDGAFLVDDQFAPLTPSIRTAIAKVSRNPVRYVINTHWHADHTGGNENFGKAGAVIVAHENVRKRMSVDQFMKAFDRTVKAAPLLALPVITFAKDLTFHWNGDDISIHHVQHAHTDGDAIIRFKKANAFHMGDCYFNKQYPFMDLGSGGSIDGMIAAADYVLGLADKKTKIIPGHGPLSTKAELAFYRKILVTVRDRIAAHIKTGKTLEEVIKAAPSKEWDAKWGRAFIKPDALATAIYQSLVKRGQKK